MKRIPQRNKYDCGVAALATFTGYGYDRIDELIGIDPRSMIVDDPEKSERLAKALEDLTLDDVDTRCADDPIFAALVEECTVARYGTVPQQIGNVLFMLSIGTFFVTTIEGMMFQGCPEDEAVYRGCPPSSQLRLDNRQALLGLQSGHIAVWDNNRFLDEKIQIKKEVILYAFIRKTKLTTKPTNGKDR